MRLLNLVADDGDGDVVVVVEKHLHEATMAVRPRNSRTMEH